MYLTSTAHSLEVETLIASDTHVSTAWVDIPNPATAFTPSSSDALITTATTTTIVAAPAASTTRQVKFVSVTNFGSAKQFVRVRRNSGSARVIVQATLDTGETLHYAEGAGWVTLDAAGVPKVRSTVNGPGAEMAATANFTTTNITTAKTLTSNTAFAVCLERRASRALTSVDVTFRVTTAAATITWAEVAIATGTPVFQANPSLTVRGFLDTAAIVNSLGIKNVNVPLTLPINEGEDVWALIGAQATTALQVRAGLGDDIQTGTRATRATTRPSLFVGTAQTYTIESNSGASMWVAARV
jgi:hypothetical protein